jgi:hypothetical protein
MSVLAEAGFAASEKPERITVSAMARFQRLSEFMFISCWVAVM